MRGLCVPVRVLLFLKMEKNREVNVWIDEIGHGDFKNGTHFFARGSCASFLPVRVLFF